MSLIKTILPVLSIFSLFTDCKQHPASQVTATTDTVPVNRVAAVQPISKDKIAYYNNACSHFFDSLLLRHGAFNGSILVAKDGNIVYEKYAGFVNPASKKDSLGIKDAFHLASVSKTFTAMAVLKLCMEGILVGRLTPMHLDLVSLRHH